MLYFGLAILHLTEDQFWSMRPVTFVSLIEAHNEYNSIDDDENTPKIPKKKKKEVIDTTVDNLPSWW